MKDDNLERTVLIRNVSFNDVVITIVVMSKVDVIIKFCFIIMFQEKYHQLPFEVVFANVTYVIFIYVLVGIMLKYSPTIVFVGLY
jgi:hypothetical protein